jgi:hypothetical protein
LEAGQYTGSMVVVIQLAAKLQIQLAAELGDPLTNMLGLGTQILVVIERCFHHIQNASLQKTIFYFTPVFSQKQGHFSSIFEFSLRKK